MAEALTDPLDELQGDDRVAAEGEVVGLGGDGGPGAQEFLQGRAEPPGGVLGRRGTVGLDGGGEGDGDGRPGLGGRGRLGRGGRRRRGSGGRGPAADAEDGVAGEPPAPGRPVGCGRGEGPPVEVDAATVEGGQDALQPVAGVRGDQFDGALLLRGGLRQGPVRLGQGAGGHAEHGPAPAPEPGRRTGVLVAAEHGGGPHPGTAQSVRQFGGRRAVGAGQQHDARGSARDVAGFLLGQPGGLGGQTYRQLLGVPGPYGDPVGVVVASLVEGEGDVVQRQAPVTQGGGEPDAEQGQRLRGACRDPHEARRLL